MDVGYIIKYGKLVPGREDKALELFGETVRFFQQHLAKGAITHFEPFIYASGDLASDLGFFMIKGPEEEVRKIVRSEDFRMLTTKAEFVVDHLREDWILVGEEVTQQVERTAKVAPEYALAH